MKSPVILYCLIFLMFSCKAVATNAESQQIRDATSIWRAAIEPGVHPFPVVADSKAAQATTSDIEVIPGTNMSAMILDKLKVSEQITAETTALFGESIDLNTGALSLQQVDVSIPGNFDIPVEFRRVYKGGSYSFYSNLHLGQWNIAIPALSTTVVYDHITFQRFSGNWGSGNMCSGDLNPGLFSVGPVDTIAAGDYWSGETLEIPGVIHEKVQVKAGSRFIKNWRFSCMYITVNGATMEGLSASSPQGLTYEFTQPKLIPAPPMSASNGIGLQETVKKYHAFLLVTRINDRFGNSVHYNYQDGQLRSVSSSDGRVINIDYETNPYQKARVKTVSANGQSWQYRYLNANHPNNNDALTEVQRPDGRKWQFNLDKAADMPSFHLKATERDYHYRLVFNGTSNDKVLFDITERQCLDITAGPGLSGYVIHPDGARLDLTFHPVRFGRSQVPNVLSDLRFRTHANDLCFVTHSVIHKKLSGPGLTPMQWHYRYSQNKGSWIHRNNGEQESGEALSGLAATPDGYNLMDLRSTQIISPDGAKTVHVFSRRWDHTDGQEVATEYYDTDALSLLRRVERQFVAMPTGGTVEMTSLTGHELGTAYLTDNPAPHENYINKISEKVFNYVGSVATDNFTTLLQDYNPYGVATKSVESNSLGSPQRTTITTYQHDTSNWVLNLETNRQISQGSENYSERSASYYAATSAEKSLRQTESRYGQLIQSHQYHSGGMLKKTTYALTNRWVEFAGYHRGKPQTITRPNRYSSGSFSISLGVNNSGTIAFADDLNGNRTHYQYDEMNRLKLIDPADSQWLNTSISYDTDHSGSASLQQNISRGNYRKTLTLDALMQPMLQKEWDSDNESQTVRYINQRFNAYGKAVFTSVASLSPAETFGTATVYDGLQRVLSQTNTANGDLSFYYGNNNSITITNSKGYSTTTHYLAYGSPAMSLASQIVQPEGVTTTISYNAANMPLSIRQGDVTEIRRYNNRMQLCLQKRPETAVKVMQYNLLGQLTDFAEGLSGNGSSCTDYHNVTNSWISQSYDNLGDAWVTSYADGTAAKIRQLDRQGNLTSLIHGNNSWTYVYNYLHLPEQQSLTLDNKNFTTTLFYNNHGHLHSKTYGGATLSYAPNALGLATQVADSQTYVSNVLYHPNGLIKSYNYGNGLTFSQSLDNQYQPYERLLKAGATMRLGQRYRYDVNDNLDAITDLVQSSQSISMTFDGLNRLKTASGSWGNGNFVYDIVGNITTKQLGSRNLIYSYEPNNKRLSTVTGGYSFSYDDRGNVYNNGKRSFQFNRANQLISSGTIGYQYDGHNRRVKKTGSSTGYSVYDLSGSLLLTEGPNGQTRYIHLGKELIAKTGSAAALEDKPGYTGHIADQDLALTYMQQRYYDPVLGRFYSNDPIGFSVSNPMSFNRYLYVNNNPYKYTDPDGRNMIPFASGQSGRLTVDMRPFWPGREGPKTEVLAPQDPAGVALGIAGVAGSGTVAASGAGLPAGGVMLFISLDGIRNSWTGNPTLTGVAAETVTSQFSDSKDTIEFAGKAGNFVQSSAGGGIQATRNVMKNAGNLGDAAGAASQVKDTASFRSDIQVYECSGRISCGEMRESTEKDK